MEREGSIGALFKFIGKNFNMWKNQLRIAFDGREIFRIVDGSETLADVKDKKAWKRKITSPNGSLPRL